jgi:hypothetical protein
MADKRSAATPKGRTPKQHQAWTDEEVLQVLTAQGYISRCEAASPEFIGLTPLVDGWWEARVRHAVAKEPDRIARARARLIALARKIEQTKIEWAEGPQSDAARDRLLATTRKADVIPLAPVARARRRTRR